MGYPALTPPKVLPQVAWVWRTPIHRYMLLAHLYPEHVPADRIQRSRCGYVRGVTKPAAMAHARCSYCAAHLDVA